MSTVITAIRDGIIHMIGDTAGVYSSGTTVYCSKVHRGDNFLLGGAGDSSTQYLALYYDFKLPPDEGLSRKDYIGGPIRKALNDVLSQYGTKENYTNVLGFYYQDEPCIIGVEGRADNVCDQTLQRWVCYGGGKATAIGAMAILWDIELDGYTILERAMEVTSKYNIYTTLPHEYHCLTTGI